jgi:CDP-diacylglycerol--inositol 3-phosphatidyltransferase
VGYYFALIDWRTTVGAYILSQGLDAADGFAARMLGQSSDFGAVLDMVTDRASTACLCIVLGHLYPELILTLTGLIMLDSFSHWRAAARFTQHARREHAAWPCPCLISTKPNPLCRFHMHASLKLGLGSHKECTNPLLRFYYRRPVLFLVSGCALRPDFSQRRARHLPRRHFCCCAVATRSSRRGASGPFAVGTELWYIALYAKKFADAAPAASAIYTLTLPVMLFKQLCNMVQLKVAMTTIIEYDEQQRRVLSQPKFS